MIKNYFCKIFFIVGLYLAQGVVFADQHESTDPEEQVDVQTAPPQPASTQETNTPSESFMPTETISEDLSVPFPVDI